MKPNLITTSPRRRAEEDHARVKGMALEIQLRQEVTRLNALLRELAQLKHGPTYRLRRHYDLETCVGYLQLEPIEEKPGASRT